MLIPFPYAAQWLSEPMAQRPDGSAARWLSDPMAQRPDSLAA